MLFTMTNVIPSTMKLIEMCGGDAESPQFICIFTKATLISSRVSDCISRIPASAEPAVLRDFQVLIQKKISIHRWRSVKHTGRLMNPCSEEIPLYYIPVL